MSGRAVRAGTLVAAPTSSNAATYFSSAAFSSPAANNVLPSVWSGVGKSQSAEGGTGRVGGASGVQETETTLRLRVVPLRLWLEPGWQAPHA
jgi:hypothetical protein